MKIFSFIFILLFLVGCSTVEVRREQVLVDNPIEVGVPVPCKVDGLTCDFTGDNYIPTYKLLQCVIVQKRIIEICSGKNKDIPSDASKATIRNYINDVKDEVESKFQPQFN